MSGPITRRGLVTAGIATAAEQWSGGRHQADG
jgi:hypothetical protein